MTCEEFLTQNHPFSSGNRPQNLLLNYFPDKCNHTCPQTLSCSLPLRGSWSGSPSGIVEVRTSVLPVLVTMVSDDSRSRYFPRRSFPTPTSPYADNGVIRYRPVHTVRTYEVGEKLRVEEQRSTTKGNRSLGPLTPIIPPSLLPLCLTPSLVWLLQSLYTLFSVNPE